MGSVSVFYFAGHCCCLTVGKQRVRDEQSAVYKAGPGVASHAAAGGARTRLPRGTSLTVVSEVRAWEGVCLAPDRDRGSLLLSSTLRITSTSGEPPSWTSKPSSPQSPDGRLPAAASNMRERRGRVVLGAPRAADEASKVSGGRVGGERVSVLNAHLMCFMSYHGICIISGAST